MPIMSATRKFKQLIWNKTFLLTDHQLQSSKRNLRLLSRCPILSSQEPLEIKIAYEQLILESNHAPLTWLTCTQDEFEISQMASLKTALVEKRIDKDPPAKQNKGGGVLENLAMMHSITDNTTSLHDKNDEDPENCRLFKK